MAALALALEQIYEPSTPEVIQVAERSEDAWSLARAERLYRSVADTALEQSVSVELVGADHTDLQDTIEQAAQGDQLARERLWANVKTEAYEIAYKAGVITKAKLEVNEAGWPMQYGQSSESISANALQMAADSPIMAPRAKAENNNAHRLRDAHAAGLLKDNYFVVISRCADASTAELKANNFFTETMSCTVQLTTEVDGELELESVFVAGVAEPEVPRHDITTTEALGSYFGADYQGLNDHQILDRPMLIPKEMLPNGGIDMACLWDQFTPGQTFFGQNRPVQDYLAYQNECQSRLEELEPRARKAFDKLLLCADQLRSPVQASQLLHKLVEAELVEEAVNNNRLDPVVFGSQSAHHIEQARRMMLQGDDQAAQTHLKQAVKTAQSSSCPSALRKDSTEFGLDDPTAQTGVNSAEKSEANTGKIRCIKCRQNVNKSEVVKKDRWECPKCQYAVDICSGAVLHKSVKAVPPKKLTPKKPKLAYNESQEGVSNKAA